MAQKQSEYRVADCNDFRYPATTPVCSTVLRVVSFGMVGTQTVLRAAELSPFTYKMSYIINISAKVTFC